MKLGKNLGGGMQPRPRPAHHPKAYGGGVEIFKNPKIVFKCHIIAITPKTPWPGLATQHNTQHAQHIHTWLSQAKSSDP